MAEDDGDKTEAPTPRRRQQAAEQGQVVRSPDLVAAALVVGAMVLLKKFGDNILAMLRLQLVDALGSSNDLSAMSAAHRLGRAIVMMGKALWPLLLGLVLIAMVLNVLQVGLNFNTKRLQPNLAALNPLKGFSKLFGGGGGPMKFVMSLAKMALIAYVAWTALSDRFMQIVMAQQQQQEQVFGLAATTLYDIALRIGLALLVLAVIDYALQRWKHERDLRMSKQEVKEEMRSMEGDPKIKSRRRQIAMQMANKRLKKDVPTADVVVTNPTEYAVALRYDSKTMIAPIVVAKGQGLIAARIRQIAIESGVPILERKPLARALYKLVEVGGAVPEQFYSAIAEILAYVYELTGKSKRRVAV
jgi:flagellar biosynthetic protein FlhB